MSKNIILRHSFFIVIASMICGFLACSFGKDLCWDLAHYHYYVAYSFFHARDKIDYWPVSYIHQFINPTIDFLTYALITFFKPFTAIWLLGAINGINLWLLFLIAKEFIKETHHNLIALLLACLGLFGPTTLPGMGSFQNDNVVALFVLGFVLLQLYAIKNPIKQNRFYFSLASGWMLGLGLGLKLTVASYVIGAFFSFVILPFSRNERLRLCALWSSGIVIGFIMLNGFWMMSMWRVYQNPFFPFFNHWFHSPYFQNINWRDVRFLPHGLWQHIFFPFYFSWDGRTADASFQDIRFMLCYVLLIFTPLALWLRRHKKNTPYFTNQEKWLLTFFLVSYIHWQITFSIARYLAPLEFLTPLLIYLLLSYLLLNQMLRLITFVTIFTAMLLLMKPIPMVRNYQFSESYFNVTLPSITTQLTHATVLMAYPAFVNKADPRPQTYLIPFFKKEWQFIGIPFWDRKYLFDESSHQKINEYVSHANHPIFLLTTDVDIKNLYHAAYRFGLKPNGSCEFITSDRQSITHLSVLLCPVKKG